MAKWTAKDKVLVFLTIAFGAVAVALVVVLAIRIHNETECDDETKVLVGTPATLTHSSVCTTTSCVKTSAGLLNAMDTSVDPCEDFFQYSCGNWNRRHILPDDKSILSRFIEVRDNVQVMLKDVLGNNDEVKSSAVTKTKDLYKSCLDENAIVATGRPDIDGILKTFVQWPFMVKSWNESSFDLETLLDNLNYYNSKYIIAVSVSPDDRNNSKYTILLDQAKLFMGSRSYYLRRNDTHVTAYKEFIKRVIMKFGAKPSDIDTDIDALVSFEIDLANLTTPVSERRDTNILYNKMNISQLKALAPQFNWKSFLNKIFNRYHITILDEEQVVVYEPEYIQNVFKLISKTNKRTVANYLITRYVLSNIKFLAEDYRLLSLEYGKVMTGIKHPGARWKECIKHTLDLLPVASGRLFVDNFFDEEAKRQAVDLIKHIRASFQEIIKESDWMDDQTRQFAVDKAEAIQERIAYPDWIKKDDELDKEHENIVINKTTFFTNVMNTKTQKVKFQFSKLREAVNKVRWYDGAAIVNAFYNPNQNTITFPAGILQPPFYSKTYPKSLIYGGIGLVIGHEITHGFDDQGRQYNKEGNLKSWWTNSSSNNFQKSAQCIIDQYSRYQMGPDHIKGKNTQGENIADNGGIKAAFKAYNNWLKNNTEDFDYLPALNLTHHQLLFLNFAQGWCGYRTPEALHKQILGDPHSPGKYRIIGTLSNSEDFAKVYKCAKGSTMNPEHKCHVW